MNLISRKELSVRLKLTPNTIWNYTNKGIIPTIMVGSQVRYHLEDVMHALVKYESKNKL